MVVASPPCNAFASHDDILSTSSSATSDSSQSDSSSASETESSEVDHSSSDSECGSLSEDSAPGNGFCSSGESNDESDSDDLLFEGSSISTNQAILEVLKLYIKQRKTKVCLNADVKLTKKLLPPQNNFPSSAKSLLSQLEKLAPSQKEISHLFCSFCQKEKVRKEEECSCGHSETNTFYEFSVEQQIQYMFEHRNLAAAIDSYQAQRDVREDIISDIQDGTEYRRVRSTLKGQYDLVLMLNTDGVQLSKSSKNELWALLSVICEVSPKRRLSYIVVSGIFVAHKKPDMNIFMKPFVKSLNLIETKNGISWRHPISQIMYKSKITCPILCADAPAKAMVLKVKSFSHRYGCNVCEQKAVKVKTSNEDCTSKPQARGRKKKKKKERRITTLRRFVYEELPAPLREGTRMNLQGNLAEVRRKSRKGVIGGTVACELPHFNRGTAICGEYMHVVLLGVVRYWLNIFFHDKGPWNMSKYINDIDSFIKSIRVPDFVTRLPRGISDLPYLKASELRAILLFYSLPAFEQYLPGQYFQHWMLLVAAIFLLLKENISTEDLNMAEVMLRCFVRDISSLYHNKYYTYNVHNLLHLTLLVRRWGPLWATSAFDFEKYNGYITSHVHGTKHLGKEFLNNVKVIQSVVVFERVLENRTIRQHTTNRIERIVCGKPLPLDVLRRCEMLAIHQENIYNFEVLDRLTFNKIVYTSRQYDADKRRSNSFVQFQEHGYEQFGEIIHFIKNNDNKIFCLISVYKIKQVDLFYLEDSMLQINHILPFQDSGELLLLPLRCLVTKVIKAGKYFCLRPNQYEVNL